MNFGNHPAYRRFSEREDKTMTNQLMKPIGVREIPGSVHCPLCTHNVPAQVLVSRKSVFSKAGQKCPRCNSSLDAAYVMDIDRAAA